MSCSRKAAARSHSLSAPVLELAMLLRPRCCSLFRPYHNFETKFFAWGECIVVYGKSEE